MFSSKIFRTAAVLLIFAPVALLAQGKVHECPDSDGYNDKPHVCEIREITVPAVASLDIDGKENGGVAVRGEDRSDIAISATVTAWGNSESAAKETLQKVQIQTEGGRIHVTGSNDSHYAVSYKISAPRNTSLKARANNGGISLTDLNGTLRFETTNGGIELVNLSGDAKGETTNGGVNVTLDGARWNGAGLDARSVNGGVQVQVPANYAAHLELSTVNGGMESNFPLTVQGQIKNNISADIGGGGPTIHIETTNGGVELQSK